MNKEYAQEGMDLKRLFLCFYKKIWILIGAIVIGAAIGSCVYLIVRAVSMPTQYQAISKIYVRFIWDPSGEVEQHYNGYTWNDLMAADPILDRTMEAFYELQQEGDTKENDISREEVVGATKAEILSDPRLLTLTFTTDHAERTKQIQLATEKGIISYGNASDEITDIKVIHSIEPTKIVWDDNTLRAGIGGGILFIIITLFAMLLYYIWDDSVYVIADAEKRYPYPVLGIFVKEKQAGSMHQPYADEFMENVSYLLKDVNKITLLGMDQREEAEEAKRIFDNILKEYDKAWGTITVDTIENDSKCCREIRETGGALLIIPAGQGNAKKVAKTISFLNNQDCNILGILITEGDSKFLKRYYGCKNKIKKTKVL